MHPSDKLRGPVLLLVLLGTVTLALALLAPIASGAAGEGSRAEQRAVRIEERTARHARRQAEAQARRAARAEQRQARRDARRGRSGDATAPGGETGGPPPGNSNSDRGCSVTIAVSAPRVLAGETVTVSGTLSCPNATSASAPRVAVYERQGGTGAATAAVGDPVTPAADGSFSMISAALEVNTVFQAREGRHRARAAVKVAPAVTLSVVPTAAPASSAVGRPGRRAKSTFTGTVTPASSGALVALQVSFPASGERWRSIAWGHVGADGTYTIAHALRTPGPTSVRAIVHAGPHRASAVSQSLPFEAPQPQDPQLTIASSADPIVAGGPVTISGLATAGAGAAVKLLARSGGGTFAVLAEGTTDATGRYSFTQSPLQSTVYRVTAAGASSTSLFEGVAFALATDPLPAAAKAGQAVTFSGSVTPAAPGRQLYLEQRSPSGIGFHAIATGTVATAPLYAITHSFTKPGTYTLRVRVPGGAGNESTASPTFSLTVES